MKKYFLPLLILTALLSGCGSEEATTEDEAAEFRKAYAHGYDEGVNAFRYEFDEEIRPAYNWVLENYKFYENNVCVASPDGVYHFYYDCYEGDDQKLMFVEDAKAYGYEKCFYCYDNYPSLDYLPSYDSFIRHYEPEYSEFVESEFVD